MWPEQRKAGRITFSWMLPGGGGSGERFNWKWLCQIRRPFFLAGGLTAECIEEASRYHPFALDVSSGIETDGFKDKKKMEKFIREARRI